ncbi:MAG: hypothetical protein D3923_05535 [Candidatus Electrothrix sp. AR3]|nr:hypothetical protein [Candidatus Electrothrix sp. AR3]
MKQSFRKLGFQAGAWEPDKYNSIRYGTCIRYFLLNPLSLTSSVLLFIRLSGNSCGFSILLILLIGNNL